MSSTATRSRPPTAGGPDAVVARLADRRQPRRSAAARASSSVGIGVPGLYDPAGGTTRFLVNLPGAWAGEAGGGAGRQRARAAGSPDQRRAGVRTRRAAPRRRARGRSMIGLTLGTGVGGVIAVDGRVHQGHDGTGGELGHQTIDPDGPTCGCGNRGCLEAFARADQIAAACGTATAEEAVARARAGDDRAIAGLARVGPLPRHRHRQHDRGHHARPGRHRRRHRGRRRPAPRTDPRRAPTARANHVRSTASRS